MKIRITKDDLGWIVFDIFGIIMLIPITSLWPLWRFMDWRQARKLD